MHQLKVLKAYLNERHSKEIIKYSKKLNSTNLSPLRSGNISIRANLNNAMVFILLLRALNTKN